MPRPTFVTGATGFAGQHLVSHLEERDEEVVRPGSSELDLRDADAVRERVAAMRPARVFHLAALASVARSWEEPARALVDNQAMALNVLEAIRHEVPDARVLIASSGEIYGAPAALPVSEDAAIAPENPYAVSKAASDLLAAVYARAHGLAVVRARPFNHAGPGQSDEYVIGTLTRQVAEAEAAGKDAVVLRTGNPDSARDFTDVRDVVRAYAVAIDLEPGAYNVASGSARDVRSLVDSVRELTELEIHHEVDPGRVRHTDVPEIRGSADRLRAAGGWEPRIPLRKTIADALDHWRRSVA